LLNREKARPKITREPSPWTSRRFYARVREEIRRGHAPSSNILTLKGHDGNLSTSSRATEAGRIAENAPSARSATQIGWARGRGEWSDSSPVRAVFIRLGWNLRGSRGQWLPVGMKSPVAGWTFRGSTNPLIFWLTTVLNLLYRTPRLCIWVWLAGVCIRLHPKFGRFVGGPGR
jgi:hypothetical protein